MLHSLIHCIYPADQAAPCVGVVSGGSVGVGVGVSVGGWRSVGVWRGMREQWGW